MQEIIATSARRYIPMAGAGHSGMNNAKAKGAKIGRPRVAEDDIPTGFLRHYPAYKAGNLNLSELARGHEMSGTTVYKYIGLLEK